MTQDEQIEIIGLVTYRLLRQDSSVVIQFTKAKLDLKRVDLPGFKLKVNYEMIVNIEAWVDGQPVYNFELTPPSHIYPGDTMFFSWGPVLTVEN